MYGYTACVNEEVPFAADLSLENLTVLVYVLDWLYVISMSYLFFRYLIPFSSLYTVFDTISSTGC